MSGFITEEHLDAAESCFPGIKRLHAELVERRRAPSTFLGLFAAWRAVEAHDARALAVAIA